MNTQKFSKRESLEFGFRAAKKHFWFFAGIMLFTLAIAYIPEIASKALERAELPSIATMFFFLAGIGFAILNILVSIGLAHISIKFAKSETAVFSDLFARSDRVFRYFISSILYGIMVALGFVLLIVPGVILMIRFQFYQYLIIEKKSGPIQALKTSWRMTRGSAWNLFILWLIIIIINLAGALALGIGLFFTVPTTMVAMAYVYKKLEN